MGTSSGPQAAEPGGGASSPGLRCPTVSARLPLFTLVMKAQSRPDSVIFPPTTWRTGTMKNPAGTHGRPRLTFRPSSAPASAGTVPSFILLFRRIRPIRRSPSLDGCQATGCWRETTTRERRQQICGSALQNICRFLSVPWRRARPRRARAPGPTTGCPCLLATEISRQPRVPQKGSRHLWTSVPGRPGELPVLRKVLTLQSGFRLLVPTAARMSGF